MALRIESLAGTIAGHPSSPLRRSPSVLCVCYATLATAPLLVVVDVVILPSHPLRIQDIQGQKI